jgi:D-glucosaminate-6-phosphate ammonia-lyase
VQVREPRRVINAKGPSTVLGAAQVPPAVTAAMTEALTSSVHMGELQAYAGSEIASLIGAEAAFVTGCSAAGMAVGVAAAIGGADLAQVTSLPRPMHARREIAIQKAHMIVVGGCWADQVILLGGGIPVEAGTAADCADFHLRAVLGPNTAAGMFVVGERASGSGTLGLARFAEICHDHGVPVIVDAAGSTEPAEFLRAGGDLVIFSSHKWFRGPTAGVVAGRADLVDAAFLHGELGVGRPMKVGKEGVAGALAAIRLFYGSTDDERPEVERTMSERLVGLLRDAKGLHSVVAPAERESTAACCVRIDVDAETTGIHAWQLAKEVEEADPSVVLYDYEAQQGYLLVDPGFLVPGDEDLIADALLAVLDRRRAEPREVPAEPPPRFALLTETLAAWRTGGRS